MARKITVVVETGKDLFSCFMSGADDLDFGLHGDGKTARKAIEDFYIARDEMKDFYEEQGREFPELEFEFVLDIGAFFSYYPFFNITQFSKFVGINAAQMRQYASGIRRPTKQKKDDINRAVRYIVEALFSESRAFCID